MRDRRETEVRWRALGRYLWVGTLDSTPVGTIERGHRYAAIDPDGRVLGRCRRLTEAQALLAFAAAAEPDSQHVVPVLARPRS